MNIINKVKIRILIESLHCRIYDSQPARGECLAPAVKIPYRRPCIVVARMMVSFPSEWAAEHHRFVQR